MTIHNVEVDILINSKPVKKFAHQGKTYIQANQGSEYSVRIRNNNPSRKLFICSIDGIDVLSGKTAGSTFEGYLINGYDSLEIKGFRTSLNEVNAFKFNQKDKSYAAKSKETNGDTQNCGVIGLRVYNEKQTEIKVIHHLQTVEVPKPYPVYPSWWYNYPNNYPWGSSIGNYTSNLTFSTNGIKGSDGSQGCNGINNSRKMSFNHSSNNAVHACMLSSSSQDDATTVCDWDMGTEFSKNVINDSVREVAFQVGEFFGESLIYYASRSALLEMGVPVIKEPQINKTPNAFPSRFCAPPQ